MDIAKLIRGDSGSRCVPSETHLTSKTLQLEPPQNLGVSPETPVPPAARDGPSEETSRF